MQQLGGCVRSRQPLSVIFQCRLASSLDDLERFVLDCPVGIARRFNAGLGTNKEQSPEGTTEDMPGKPSLRDSALSLRVPGVELNAGLVFEQALRDSHFILRLKN